MRKHAQLWPDSAAAHHWCGQVLKDQGQLEEAVREFARDIEINPATPWAFYNISLIRLWQNRLSEALDAAQSAVRLSPPEYRFHALLLEVLDKMGNDDQTLAVMRKNARSFPDSDGAHFWYGFALTQRGRLDEATREFARELEINPNPARPYDHALLHLQCKQLDAYRRLCESVVEHAVQSSAVQDASSAGINCKLAPNALADYAPLLKLLENAINEDPENRLFRGVQAHLFYWSGQTTLAAEDLEQLVSIDETGSIHEPFDKLFLAMAHHDLGHEAEAKRYFREATDWIDKNGQAKLQEGAVLKNSHNWQLRLELKLLRTEAEQRLGMMRTTPDAPNVDKP